MKSLIGNHKVHFAKGIMFYLMAFVLFFGMSSCKHKNTQNKGQGGGGSGTVEKSPGAVKEGELGLTSFTLGKKLMSIQDVMNGDNTFKKRVRIAYQASPSGATVEFEPKLGEENRWALNEIGENILKIRVKNGDKTKEYTLKVKRLDKSPLRSLTIGSDTKYARDQEGIARGIDTDMEFAVPFTVAVPDVSTEVQIAMNVRDDFEASWDAVLPGGKTVPGEKATPQITIDKKTGEIKGKISVPARKTVAERFNPTYKLTLKKGEDKLEYTVKLVKMMAMPKIKVGSNQGKASITSEDLRKILGHEKNIELKMYGPELELSFKPRTDGAKWKSFVIREGDGDDEQCLKVDPNNSDDISAKKTFKLARGESKKITIKIEDNGVEDKTTDGKKRIIASEGALAREEFQFTLKREDATADHPSVGLFIAEEDTKAPKQQLTYADENEGEEAKLHRPQIFEELCSTDANKQPVFYAGKPCEIRVKLPKNAKSITIAGQNIPIKEIKHIDTNAAVGSYVKDVTYYTYESALEVSDFDEVTGKDVVVEIEPSDDNANNYHKTIWKFKLKYLETQPINLDYEINGTSGYVLENFKELVEAGKKPQFDIHGKSLNFKVASETIFSEVKITCGSTTETFALQGEGERGPIRKITVDLGHGQKSTTYICAKSIALPTNDVKDVKIEITPKNKGKYAKKILEFKVKADGTQEKMKPTISKIDNDEHISQDFIKKLTETVDANLGEYQVSGNGTTASVVLQLPAYDADFLYDRAKVNGIDLKFEPVQKGSDLKYEATILVGDMSATAKIINVLFEGKNGIAENVNWKFKLKNGGTQKPSLPASLVSLSINGKSGGDAQNPLPEYLVAHLTDGTNPIYEIYGEKAVIKLDIAKKGWIENIDFNIAGELDASEEVDEAEGVDSITHEFNIPKPGEEYLIQLVFNSKKAEYDKLVQSFRIKSLDEKQPMNCTFVLNKVPQPSGHTEDLNMEYATLLTEVKMAVDSKTKDSDWTPKVEIGLDGGTLTECTGKVLPLDADNKVYQASLEVKLDPTARKTYVIKVTPNTKKAEKFGIAECRYTLKGKTIDNHNAEFAVDSRNSPMVTPEVTKWKVQSKYPDDIGAEEGKITVKTVSPRATVKYQQVDVVTLQPVPGDKGVETTLKSVETADQKTGLHVKENIALETDKPTKLKVWVIAEDGTTTDSAKGLWYMTFNPVPVFWGYLDSNDIKDFTQKAYDEIKVDVSKLKTDKDGKKLIYIMACPWREDWGFTMNNDDLPSGQSKFKAVGLFAQYQQACRSSLDVSDLASGSATEKEVKVKLNLNKQPCFTYKLKVTKKS